MDPKKIGQFIQMKRKEKRLTQTELAELLGVTDKAISRWETGEGFPEITMLPKLSIIFGVTVDDLLNGEVVKREEKSSKGKANRFDLKATIIFSSMIFLSVISVMIAFAVFTALWPFIIVITSVFIGIILFNIFKSQYIEVTSYNDEVKDNIYSKQKRLYLITILSVVLYLPIIIGYIYFASTAGILSGIINMFSYLLFMIPSVILGLLTYSLLTYSLDRKTYGHSYFDKIRPTIIYYKFEIILSLVILILLVNMLNNNDPSIVFIVSLFLLPIYILLLCIKKVSVINLIIVALCTIIMFADYVQLEITIYVTSVWAVFITSFVYLIFTFNKKANYVNFLNALQSIGLLVFITFQSVRFNLHIPDRTTRFIFIILISIILFCSIWLPIKKKKLAEDMDSKSIPLKS